MKKSLCKSNFARLIGGSCIVTLVVASNFLSQNFGGGMDLEMVFCHSMNAVEWLGQSEVVVILKLYLL